MTEIKAPLASLPWDTPTYTLTPESRARFAAMLAPGYEPDPDPELARLLRRSLAKLARKRYAAEKAKSAGAHDLHHVTRRGCARSAPP
jgi:hypothetical protein